MAPFSFLTSLICASVFFLITPSMGFSILLVFSENQLLTLLIFFIICFCSISLISALSFFPFYLLGYNWLPSINSSNYFNLTSYYTTLLKLIKLMAFLFSNPADTYVDSCSSSSQNHLHSSYIRHSSWFSCLQTLLSPIILFPTLFHLLISLLPHI